MHKGNIFKNLTVVVEDNYVQQSIRPTQPQARASSQRLGTGVSTN